MKKQESGRSMIEMLGVLAIIGVLSIGGIAGYTLSMNRYRANKIADVANKLASLAYSECMSQLATGSVTSEANCNALKVGKNTAEHFGLGTPENTILTVTAINRTNGVTITAVNIPENLINAYKSITNANDQGVVTIKQN